MKSFEVYKPPFNAYGGYIWTSNGTMAFTPHFNSDEMLRDVCLILNSDDPIKQDHAFIYRSGRIEIDGQPFLSVRGWGQLRGCGGFDLPIEEAEKLYNEFGEWAANKLSGKL